MVIEPALNVRTVGKKSGIYKVIDIHADTFALAELAKRSLFVILLYELNNRWLADCPVFPEKLITAVVVFFVKKWQAAVNILQICFRDLVVYSDWIIHFAARIVLQKILFSSMKQDSEIFLNVTS